jgi:KaiC/GvpD/RAD55 family RecA-like ATPase
MSEGKIVSLLGRGTFARSQTKPKMEGLVRHGLNEFLRQEYGKREKVLAPWLPVHGLAMISGKAGQGKTYLGLSVAYAIASGGEVLGWQADKPRKVVYVDGEMPLTDLQDRVRAIHDAAVKDGNGDKDAALDNLTMLCDQEQEEGIPDLAGDDDTGRKLIEEVLNSEGAEVLMLDNISALFRYSGSSANEEESWIRPQEWLRSLRRRGYTVVLFHHTGKPDSNGNTKQRGTSKKEDILDTSILLEVPNRKKHPTASFLVGFTKHRGFIPPDEQFPVEIVHKGGDCRLQLTGLEAAILKLHEEHPEWSQTTIAAELGTKQYKVSRVLNPKKAA